MAYMLERGMSMSMYKWMMHIGKHVLQTCGADMWREMRTDTCIGMCTCICIDRCARRPGKVFACLWLAPRGI